MASSQGSNPGVLLRTASNLAASKLIWNRLQQAVGCRAGSTSCEAGSAQRSKSPGVKARQRQLLHVLVSGVGLSGALIFHLL
jgi:hypothetical protein